MHDNIKWIQLPATGFLRLPQVLFFLPFSRSKWWDGCRKGIFPKAYKLDRGVTAWAVEDIRAFIERIKAEDRQQRGH